MKIYNVTKKKCEVKIVIKENKNIYINNYMSKEIYVK